MSNKQFLFTTILVAIGLGILERWYKTDLIGLYYLNSGIFLAILGAVVPFITIFVIYKIIKNIN